MAYEVVKNVLSSGAYGATPIIDVTGDSNYEPASIVKATPVVLVGGGGGAGDGVTSWNGQTGDVTYTPPVTSVNGQTGDVVIEQTSNVVRGETTPSGSLPITATPTTVTSIVTSSAGNYRFYISGNVVRTGGSSALGTLTLTLKDGATVLTSGTFEIFRDMNTIKQIATVKTFDIPTGTTLTVTASYTPASSETFTVNSVICGYDCVVN